jgi:hypothetical protein
LPAGVSLKPQIVPGSQKLAPLVISADLAAKTWAGAIKVVGTATVKGQKLVREVRAATVTWPTQAPNVPAIARLDRELVLAVRDPAPFTLTATVDKVTVLMGENISVPFKLTRNSPDVKGPVQVTALALPAGLILQQPLTLNPGKDTGTAVFTSKQPVPPGVYTIVARGQATSVLKDQKQPKKNNVTFFQPSTPVTVTIVPKQLAKLSNIPNSKIQPGKKMDVTVQVARLFDYTGPFKVELVVPPGTKGVSAPAANVKEGENQTTLALTVAPDAPTGTRQLTVRATAMFADRPIVHETKLTLNVVK